MDNYWSPKDQTLGQLVNASQSKAVGSASATNQTPKPEMPEIGAKMLLVVHPYGGMNVVPAGNNLVGGLDLIEVEVTALKKSKTTIE